MPEHYKERAFRGETDGIRVDKAGKKVILGIESSCDETAAAVLVDGELRSNIIAGQSVHAKWGGVVPELASRAHQEHIVPVVHQALQDAEVTKDELDAVAFTHGPGLIGALLVGTCFARSMAQALRIPLIAVDHLHAHALAHFIQDGSGRPVPSYPFINFTVSGGHTMLVIVHSPQRMEVIGTTLDDAAGEAFDKGAKMLGLPYPGGPLIEQHARTGDPKAFALPHPQVPDLNMSFSGVKAGFLQVIQRLERERPGQAKERVDDLAASLQGTIVDILIGRLTRAVMETGISHVAISGGVSANSLLRKSLLETGERKGWHVYIPPLVYCTDNAAMVAMAGQLLWNAGVVSTLDTVPVPRTH